MAPPAVFLLPLFLLFTKVFVIGDWSLFDTRTGLILLYCVFNLPFAIWLLKGIIDAIPVELDEAAMLDGAGTWQVLTRVIVPLARTGLAEFVTVTGTNWGEMAAVATLTLLPAVIFLGVVQRHIVAGLTFGALKE